MSWLKGIAFINVSALLLFLPCTSADAAVFESVSGANDETFLAVQEFYNPTLVIKGFGPHASMGDILNTLNGAESGGLVENPMGALKQEIRKLTTPPSFEEQVVELLSQPYAP